MTIHTRALTAVGDGSRPVVRDILLIPPTACEVLVEIDAAAVCSTERMTVDRSLAGSSAGSSPITVLGHAATGTVTVVGEDVERVAPGDRVVIFGTRQCGRCWYCVNGVPGACEEIFTYMQRLVGHTEDGDEVWSDGGMGTHAERMVFTESNVVKVDGNVPVEHLALLGCGVVSGVGSVRAVAGVSDGQSVAISGLGHLGLWMVQGARNAGASTIIAVDPHQERRAIALSLGATHALSPGPNLVEQVRSLTSGRGADVSLEAAGTTLAIEQAFACTRFGGTVVPTGLESEVSKVTLSNLQLALESRTIIGSQCGGGDVLRLIPELEQELANGSLSAEPLVTALYSLSDAHLAYDTFEKPELLTSVIVPTPQHP